MVLPCYASVTLARRLVAGNGLQDTDILLTNNQLDGRKAVSEHAIGEMCELNEIFAAG